MTLGLTAKIVRLHRAFDAADLPHAFGGALALAFCVAEPAPTQDIDVNVFVPVDRVGDVITALPRSVVVTKTTRAQLARDAQARARWGETPIDLFLSNHPFHDHACANRRGVPFAGVDLPVLACADLAVFKAFFARPKDAVDVAAMVLAGAVEAGTLERDVAALLGPRERRSFFERLAEFVAEQS